MSIFNLPPELIDLVIRLDIDVDTLRSCALVCRAFLQPSQRYLFATVDLGTPHGPVPRFHDLLRNSPHLCAHVRELAIVHLDYRGQWQAWYPSLAAVLDLLPNVTMFTLSFLPHVKWGDLPANVQAAICALCQRSPLVNLRVDGAGTINSVTEFSQLVASPALKLLSLKDLDIPVAGPDEIPPTHRIALTDLVLDSNSPTLAIITPWLVDGGSLSQTISISCNCTPETVSHSHALTHAAAATLESVTLHSRETALTTPVRLGGPQQKLHKVIVLLVVDVNHFNRLAQWLAVLLDSCPRSLRLFHVAVYLSARDPNLPVGEPDWASVAELFVYMDELSTPG
ncbi:hypothetical protein B0H16DRAFT_748420 [Mycena metata]|uniref:F-box domain-containing protein n=1 Tax=Mycena metata TaxID=1033252 RepID=A0AAD7NC46_9AGAR|nr:hypothetical protein B0H16DRAFT_748420 [Mycena metata]